MGLLDRCCVLAILHGGEVVRAVENITATACTKPASTSGDNEEDASSGDGGGPSDLILCKYS